MYLPTHYPRFLIALKWFGLILILGCHLWRTATTWLFCDIALLVIAVSTVHPRVRTVSYHRTPTVSAMGVGPCPTTPFTVVDHSARSAQVSGYQVNSSDATARAHSVLPQFSKHPKPLKNVVDHTAQSSKRWPATSCPILTQKVFFK